MSFPEFPDNIIPENVFVEKRKKQLGMEEAAHQESEFWIGQWPKVIGASETVREVVNEGKRKLEQWFREHPPLPPDKPA